MNRGKLLVTGLCAAAVVSLSSAGANAEDKIAPKTLEFLEATTISGYVEASYVYNIKSGIIGNSDQNQGTGDANGGGANQLRAFDNNIGFTMNAVKLVFEKPLGEGDWSAGYRVDLLFGEDAMQLSRAEGSGSPFFNEGDTDGLGGYVEQGYVAFRVPVGNGLDFKMGRFVSLSGYEVIESPANLNFSRGLLFTWATPIAHSGLLASYRFSDALDAQVGLVNGVNTWMTDNLEPALIGRVGVRNASGTMSLGVSGYYGRARTQDSAFAGTSIDTGTRWFVDGVANFKPTEKVLLGFEALVGDQESPFGDPNGGTNKRGHDMWWGVAGYVKVQLSDKVSLAGRAEYLNDRRGFLFDDNHASFDPSHNIGTASRVEVYSLTGTLGFDVWKNMLLRLEARYDQASESGNGKFEAPFSTQDDQLTFAVDAVYSF